MSGLSSPVLRFYNDRRVRILKVKVCLDSLLQCLDFIMCELLLLSNKIIITVDMISYLRYPVWTTSHNH